MAILNKQQQQEEEEPRRHQTHKHRRKMPSFSSSLLDAIYLSIDDHHPPPPHRRDVEEEIESLRRAIMIEKWMDRHSTTASTRHLPSNSASSTDSSSIFTTSSETTDSSTPKPPVPRENRFSRTKSRALKIYGDLKKVKEPISPAAKISNFFNSIFSPRSSSTTFKIKEDWAPVTKSRSMNDPTSSSRSCLTKNTATNSSRHTITNSIKSKRSVRFNVIRDERSSNSTTANPSSRAAANVGSTFIKKKEININDGRDFDDKSCASSDLFELENIGAVGDYDAELPVYGTTDIRFL